MSERNPRGKIEVNIPGYATRVDSLFRVSLKALIYNEAGEMLVVKEEDKDWDAPGGGMDHGETYEQALRRELKEEIGYDGDLSMQFVGMEEPFYIKSLDCMQIVVAFRVNLDEFHEPRIVSDDVKAIRYINPEELKANKNPETSAIYKLHLKAS